MSKNTLGELKLSPIKENGKFVFINNEVRVNGKLNKGDYIKIFVDFYELQDGQYMIKNSSLPSSKIVVRGGAPIMNEYSIETTSVEELYNKVGETYKNQFYFGKTEI